MLSHEKTPYLLVMPVVGGELMRILAVLLLICMTMRGEMICVVIMTIFSLQSKN